MLGVLAPRGEIREVSRQRGLLAGTWRLPIVDREHAVQPWASADGRWLMCYNGELFNFRELRAQLHAAGRPVHGESGTEARVPFLDLALVELAMRLPVELKLRAGQEKWILREAFADVLPHYIRHRP